LSGKQGRNSGLHIFSILGVKLADFSALLAFNKLRDLSSGLADKENQQQNIFKTVSFNSLRIALIPTAFPSKNAELFPLERS
jgi:hypothetical protein